MFKVRLELAHRYNLRKIDTLERRPLETGPYSRVIAPVLHYETPCNSRLLLHISKTDDNDVELQGNLIITRSNHFKDIAKDHVHKTSTIRVGLPACDSWMHYCYGGAYVIGIQLNTIQLSLDTLCHNSIKCDCLVSLHICGVLNQNAIDETIFVKLTKPKNTGFINQYCEYVEHGDPKLFHYTALGGICLCGFCDMHPLPEAFNTRQLFLIKLTGCSIK